MTKSNNNLLSTAIAITAKAFEGVLDQGGSQYILHCLRVMHGVNQRDQELMCIAVMHDLLEDTHFTPLQLMKMGNW